MKVFAPACGKTGIVYTGRSRKKYVVLGRLRGLRESALAVRAPLPDGRTKLAVASASGASR